MKSLRIWKMLAPPATIPFALWMFVALAGPGGPVEVSGGTPPPDVGHRNHAAAHDGAGVDGDGSNGDAALDEGQATATDADVANSDGAQGCEWALTEQAKAHTQLEGHVSDSNTPAGGADGNRNALDKQCGGAFAEASAGDATPTADLGTEPGKSEQAPGGAAAGGQAQGQGQANADANGNGPGDAPGHNKP